jgi:hypothetical protein
MVGNKANELPIKAGLLQLFCMYLNNPDLVEFSATTNIYFWRHKNESVSRMSVCTEIKQRTVHLKYLYVQIKWCRLFSYALYIKNLGTEKITNIQNQPTDTGSKVYVYCLISKMLQVPTD